MKALAVLAITLRLTVPAFESDRACGVTDDPEPGTTFIRVWECFPGDTTLAGEFDVHGLAGKVVTLALPMFGRHWMSASAVDEAGNESCRCAPVFCDGGSPPPVGVGDPPLPPVVRCRWYDVAGRRLAEPPRVGIVWEVCGEGRHRRLCLPGKAP